MDNIDNQGQANLPSTAGGRLRAAREAAGLSRSDIASQTKIAERHLLAIEDDRLGDLAARTYAVGFSRAYARALGVDEAEIAALVHSQLDAAEFERHDSTSSFEPGDPARVPPVRLAWLAAGAAVAVVVLLLIFWGNFLSPEGKLPDLLSEEKPKPVASAPAALRPPPQPVPSTGPVVLTATGDEVWVSVTDAGGAKLLERKLAKGESWTVPAGAQTPKLRTGRPDALQLSVGGKAIPSLADRPETISDVSLVPSDLLARTSPAASPTASQPSQAASPPPKAIQRAAPAVAPAPVPSAEGTGSRPQAMTGIETHAPTAAATPSRHTAAAQASKPAVKPAVVEPASMVTTPAGNVGPKSVEPDSTLSQPAHAAKAVSTDSE